MGDMQELLIIGGGLAGCEAAWQAAERGMNVRLVEMRPATPTAVHHSDRLAELVCSSSLKSLSLTSASGLLNEEMRRLGSLILACGHAAAIPGGQALAVDRDEFAARVTAAVEGHPGMAALTGSRSLAFFDAIAPTLEADSIDQTVTFRASRYDKGGADYLNCPFDRAAYDRFYDALLSAERFVPKHPDDTRYFESCLPIEVIAERGRDAPRFGPLKPVGLDDPRTGRWPHAVVQLRQENRAGTLYGLVGCQTQLRRGEQERVFRLVPGLEAAVFARYGQVHRNTFVDSPRLLTPHLHLRERPELFLAGQLIGVEGYVESAAAGWLAGVNAARRLRGEPLLVPPETTMLGALVRYVSDPWVESFQPMNANFGILPPVDARGRAARKQAHSDRALAALDAWWTTVNSER
ncbi:MAG: methylenetetrahydrofolate--tRNA-(uracil(54)-C(5))-methyltransferase (FADH(2)-oxidizing) TrmFO [Armatimonadetes bacterium]|nr:methylenetetrahydrofolate--tRNA-(uracil(54)-C(5))-methyltransferase (FADH(2)-oxidizing) TrmFO [Armatimonadota bacterium]